MNRKPTIYEALETKIGRTPTASELKADFNRILQEVEMERAEQRENAAPDGEGMNQFEITKGSRKVIVTSQDGNVDARLYVGNGEIAATSAWNGKTEAGARKWAAKIIERNWRYA